MSNPVQRSTSSLEGKTAIVTGDGRGIWAATSKLLAARGANVIANYLSNKESAERVVSEIKASKEGEHARSGDALANQADVRDANQVQRMVDEAIKQYDISISWSAMPMWATTSSSRF